MEKQDDISWSPEEMIQKAGDWSLAGDVAVLNYLKKFSEKVLTETVKIGNNVDQQINTLNEVSLKLDLVKNEFYSLRNSQFIESRVYEDDETVDDDNQKSNPKIEEVLTEDQKQERIKNAILMGTNAMKKYYDKVEVDVSDSEDDNETSYILRPKDFYRDRPLPYIVGTEEWHKKLHVGLLLSDSESESEKEADIYSSSDSESGLPKDRMPSSETSSELSIQNVVGPAANSTFNDTIDRRTGISHTEENDSQNSYPAQTPISSQNFAEQLAEKLGNVISGDNLDKNQRKLISKASGTFFSDEPPPLDDLDDTILPKPAQSGLFSGGRDLFGDDDDMSVVKTNATDDNLNNTGAKKGIFVASEDSSSEDDMFEKLFKKHNKPSKKPYFPSTGNMPPMIDDQPPEITTKNKGKKPIGGVSIFGESANLFGNALPTNTLQRSKTQLEDSKQSENVSTEKPTSLQKEGLVKNINKTSLFDQSDDDDSDILIDNKVSEKGGVVKNAIKKNWKKTSLFEESEDEDFFTPTIPKKQPEKNISLFDSDDNEEYKIETVKTKKLANKDSLFDNDNKANQLANNTSVFGSNNNQSQYSSKEQTKEISNKPTYTNLSNDTSTVTESNQNTSKTAEQKSNSTQKKISLFDSDPEEDLNFLSTSTSHSKPSKKYKSIFDDDDDIFGNTDDIFEKKTTPTKPIINLLGDSNEVRSKNLSDLLKKDSISTTKNEIDLFNDKIRSKEKSNNNVSIISDKNIKDKTDPDHSVLEKTDNYPEMNNSALNKDSEETISEDIKGNNDQKLEFKAKLRKATGLFDSSEESEEDFSPPKNEKNSETEPHSKENNSTSFKNIIEKNSVKAITSKNIVLPIKNDKEENCFQSNKENLKEAVCEPSSDTKPKSNGELVQNSEENGSETKTNINIFDSLHQDDDISCNSQSNHDQQDYQDKKSNEDKSRVSDSEDSVKEFSEKLNDKEGVNKYETLLTKDNKNRDNYTAALEENRPESEDNLTEKESQCKENDFSDLSGPFQYPKINILESSVLQEHQPPPLIGLFDPTPPPMGDTSNDDSSDGFDGSSINDDDFSHEPHGRQMSGMFDNEPPLLNPNESSGIVRDQNVTRVDTDDSSSFYPYASSSRRFSSDIFNDQESQDNLFVTRRQSENSFSGLKKIPECDKSEDSMSKTDITPSGNIDDFLSSSSVFDKTETSVKDNDTSATPKPKKKIDLFATSEDEFLFNPVKKSSVNTSSVKENSAKLTTEQKIITDEVDKDVSSSKIIGKLEDLVTEKTFLSNELLDHKTPVRSPQTEPKVMSPPKKLKHNLEINVAALLPGAGLPKKKGVVKSVSFEDTGAVKKVEKSVSFKDAVIEKMDEGDSGILKSVTKDRAKIPVRRRPSTRKGRQESIRNSIADFRLYQDNEETRDIAEPNIKSDSGSLNKDDSKIPDSEKGEGDEPTRVSLVFDKSDHNQNEEIIKEESFKNPESLKSDEKNISDYKTPPKPSIFNEGSSSDDEDLFKTVSTSKTNKKMTEKTSAAADLFKSTSKSENLERKKVGEIPKKSLFDSDESDNDLFSVKKSDSKLSTKPIERRPAKTAAIKKLENKEVADDDPLQSFH